MHKKLGVSFFGSYSCVEIVITFIQKMGRKRIKGTKYNRVTKQQKYVFLKLCITEKQSIHEAAFNAGIHYSTAKTILFFHKKQYKNYSTYIVEDPNANMPPANLLQAGWRDIPIDVDQERTEPTRIQLVVNSKKKMLEEKMKNKEKGDSTSEGKDSDPFAVKLEEGDLHVFLQEQKNNIKMHEQPALNGPKKENLDILPKVESPKTYFY